MMLSQISLKKNKTLFKRIGSKLLVSNAFYCFAARECKISMLDYMNMIWQIAIKLHATVIWDESTHLLLILTTIRKMKSVGAKL
jgi:hypothetical protein